MPYTPLQLAEAYIQTGELHDALDALDQQLAAHPQDDVALRLRAAVLLRLPGPRNLQEALATLDQIATPTTQDDIQRSIILERDGDLYGALAIMRTAHQAEPETGRITERLLKLLIAGGAVDEALAIIRQQPRTWRWLQWEGDLLVLTEDDRMATARYGLALAQLQQEHDIEQDRYLAPVVARLLLARAHAYRRLDELASAEEHYEQAAAIIPDDPAIPFNRGLMFALQGDPDTATELCREAFADAPPALREEMLQEIQRDPRLQVLADALGK